MANVTISLPDELLRRAREYAAKRGSSLNALIRGQLEREVATSPAAVDEMVERLKRASGRSRGWRFNRDDLQRHA
jgi:predicted transcriptional regulator